MMNPAEFANIAKAEKEFWWYRGMERILFRMLGPLADCGVLKRGPGVAALEVGCGTGYMATRFAEQYGWKMFPTDIHHEGLLYGREQGVERLAQAAIAALPFANGRFDVAVSLDMLVYMPPGDEGHAIGELARVLAPDGLLVLRTAALEILRSHHAEFTGERQRYQRAHLLRVAAENGLKVLRCTYANSLLMPIALAKFRVIEPLLGSKPSSGVQLVSPWLDRLLYKALDMESSWIGSGRDLPIGQSLILIAERTR